DLLAGLGPSPLSAGDVLPLGEPADCPPPVDVEPQPAPPAELVLRLRLGPRDDWFTADALRLLGQARYTVASASNRIALRTEGPALARAIDAELPSGGMVLRSEEHPSELQSR